MGAGIGFYSARDAVVSYNTLYNVSTSSMAAVVFNLSPKVISLTQEVAAPNRNINFYNNIVTQPQGIMVEYRVMQATLGDPASFTAPSTASCPGVPMRRTLRGIGSSLELGSSDAPQAASSSSDAAEPSELSEPSSRSGRKLSATSLPWALAWVNRPGTKGRNADGSCPVFPDDNAWHMDVRNLPVHPRSAQIKAKIRSTGGLHPDFAGGDFIDNQRIYYGIPFITVDSSKPNGPAKLPVDVVAYPDESDLDSPYAIPDNAPVEGAYPGCSPDNCGGDRHVLVIVSWWQRPL